MTELERMLAALGRELEFPPAPDLAAAFDAGRAVPHRRPRRITRTLVLAFALLLLAVGTAFAVPQSRHAILEWLGLEGVTVERVVTLPEAPAVADLDLGERVSLEEAGRRADFPVLVPELLGAPPATYANPSTLGGRISLVYPPSDRLPGTSQTGVGLLVTEFRGALAPELIGKLVGSGTTAEAVSVTGAPGIWIAGRPHVFFYADENGDYRDETLRLAGNTLVFERDGVLVRLESRLTKAAALGVAASMTELSSGS